MRAKRMLVVGALLIAMLACNLPVGQGPSQPPDLVGTITAQAMLLMQSTNTPALTATPAFTALPSLTPTQAFTATPSVPQVSVTGATNCRTGPGVAYDLLYVMQPGQVAQIVGKDIPDNYWIIKMPSGKPCWLWGQYALASGNIGAVPDVAPPPTPTPSLPAAPSAVKIIFDCALSSSPFLHNNVHVEIGWQDNAINEQGYYVFRDDTLLATLDANATSFTDDTTMVAIIPPGSSAPHLTYSIQTFNTSGKSKKVSKSISCFD